MNTRFMPAVSLAAIILYSGTAQAQQAALYYDAVTEVSRVGNITELEGMAWGYFHTGTLTESLTISVDDPVSIQLFDQDVGERYVGGANDELQVWISDTDLTAAAGESVRFEFFSVVPTGKLNAADDAYRERGLEIRAQFIEAPDGLTSTWNSVSWPSAGQNWTSRASTFSGYPAADHVVRLYYVYPGEGFSGITSSSRSIPVVVSSGSKKIWGNAAVSETMVDSSTNENIWDNGISGRNMRGVIIVENTSDREGMEVTLDFLELLEDDSPNIAGNDDDLLGSAESTAPANFNLGPGGTLRWEVSIHPEFEDIDDARDFGGFDGDLEPYALFSVNGDPELDVAIVPDDEVEVYGTDLPPTTYRFAAASTPDPLPDPPTVTFSGNAGTYTVDEDVEITCTVTDNGGGIVYDTCFDTSAPAWGFPAGTTTLTASAFDLYGQEGSDTAAFEVTVTYDSLIAITERFVDHSGIENSLVKKIENAEKAKTDSAQDNLCGAYINEVEAQTGKFVDEDDAEVLIYWAEQLQLQ